MSAITRADPPDMTGPGRASLAIGVAGLALCGLGAYLRPEQFFRSYLMGYLFWLGIALGCLGVVMLHHLSGGAWGIVIRRPLESATRTLPLLALLFLPLLFGLEKLYVWADSDKVEASEILRHKAVYLNVPFFLARLAIYFAVWMLLAWLLNRWSGRQDTTEDPAMGRRMTTLAGPGIILYVLTMTFASVDWVMSLEPYWFSTIFGGLIVAGQALSALSFAIAVLFLLAGREPMSRYVSAAHFHDLGKLMLAFVMVWSYFAFSQFLIIWSGNLPEEIPYYLARLQGGWEWIGVSLVVLQFAAPFLLLLSRDLKRNAGMLTKVAVLVVVLRLVDLYWTIAPAFHPASLSFHWLDIAAPVGIGGIWLAFFIRQLQRRALLPLGDAQLGPALEGGE